MADRRTLSKRTTLSRRIAGKHVCVCVGPGGVGKTTVSAAVGLGLAAQGRRVVVVTIDPAKRLASALGLRQLSGKPHRIGPEMLATTGLQVQGELWAMALDVKGTFDGLIAQLAPEESARARILDNRIYRELSSAISGSQELSALMKLYELSTDERFDAIVLDTPPSRNALDFLETPARLQRFLDGRALGLFLSPGGLAARLFGRSSAVILSVFSRASGIDFMGDLSEFFGSLAGTIDGFRERANSVDDLLHDPENTAFLVVTSPEVEAGSEAAFLAKRLTETGIPRAGLIFNRVQPHGLDGETAEGLEEMLTGELGEHLARRVALNLADLDVLYARDRRSVAELSKEVGERRPTLVPHLEHDVQDLAGLAQITEHLFG